MFQKEFVKKAAGVCAVCAFTVGINVAVAGPSESTLLQEMGLVKTAYGMECGKNSHSLYTITETPFPLGTSRIDLQKKRRSLWRNLWDHYLRCTVKILRLLLVLRQRRLHRQKNRRSLRNR